MTHPTRLLDIRDSEKAWYDIIGQSGIQKTSAAQSHMLHKQGQSSNVYVRSGGSGVAPTTLPPPPPQQPTQPPLTITPDRPPRSDNHSSPNLGKSPRLVNAPVERGASSRNVERRSVPLTPTSQRPAVSGGLTHESPHRSPNDRHVGGGVGNSTPRAHSPPTGGVRRGSSNASQRFSLDNGPIEAASDVVIPTSPKKNRSPDPRVRDDGYPVSHPQSPATGGVRRRSSHASQNSFGQRHSVDNGPINAASGGVAPTSPYWYPNDPLVGGGGGEHSASRPRSPTPRVRGSSNTPRSPQSRPISVQEGSLVHGMARSGRGDVSPLLRHGPPPGSPRGQAAPASHLATSRRESRSSTGRGHPDDEGTEHRRSREEGSRRSHGGTERSRGSDALGRA
ncbi:hypothetical protein BD410DRAFT_398951 [Rickenella mellea]|uniref:Uncharacterized protein n=1 Tax=Rickenella mellea TaxID=50990 RepID=A0A4Y7PXJ5_9AGAM|nr:hypothetical protein BD410DRAFT_398951 [Rickenella mellea]